MLWPLAGPSTDSAQLVAYSGSIGYEIDLTQAEHILAELEPQTTALTEAFELASDNGIDASSASAIGLAAQGLLSALARQISLAVGNDAKQGDIYEDVFYSLLRLYLGARVPFAVALLQALGVMSEPNTPVDPDAQPPSGGGRVTFDWARLANFIQNTNHWALDTYGWGGTDASSQRFDHIQAMARIAKLVEMLQIATTHLRPLTAAESLALLGPQASDGALRVDLPLFQADFSKVDPDGEPLFDTELGLSLLPFSDPSNREDHGFAISPYALGATTIDQSLSDGVRLAVSVEADIQAGARPLLAITPRGWRSLSLDTTGHLSVVPSLRVQVDASLSYTTSSGPMWVIGSESGSRVQSAGTRFSVRVSAPDEIVVSVSELGVQVVVDLSEDSFLKSFLGAPARISIGDISVGFSSQRGGFVDATLPEGGFGLTRSVEMNVTFGPILLTRADLSLQLDAPNSGGLHLRASAGIELVLSLGPVRAALSSPGGSLSLDLSGDRPGELFSYDFVPPLGAGITIEAGVVAGGGFISYDPALGRYFGTLELRAQQLGINAVALIETRLPAGAPGYAVLVVLRATFPAVQIGLGFALTAVGGLLAVNRKVDVDALRGRFATGTAGRILAPEDPLRNTPTLLADLDAVFPISPGVTVVGPTAQLIWAGLVHLDVGIFIELPGPARVVLLGSAHAEIERNGRAYLSIRVDIVGVVDLRAETAAFDAVLIGSHLMGTLDLTGGAAFRLSWGAQPYAVLSLGGFNPAYHPEPLTFPATLTRIAMVHGKPGDELYLRFEGYFAITSNTLQFGASVEAVIHSGHFIVHGTVGFDALIQFIPFHFQIDLRASVSLTYRGHTLAGLTLTGSLTGPGPLVLHAKVCIELLFFDICYSGTFTLGPTTPPPVPAPADLLDTLLTELTNPAGLRAAGAPDTHVRLHPPDPSLTMPVIAPTGTLVWEQQRAPLDLLLTRVGGTPLPAPARVSASAASSAPVSDWFAPGQFTDLTDDQALTRPAYELLTAGVRLAGTDAVDGPGAQSPLSTRQIRLPAKAVTPDKPVIMFPAWIVTSVDRPAAPVVTVIAESWIVTSPAGDLTGLSGAQARQLATLTATARAIPAADRLPAFTF